MGENSNPHFKRLVEWPPRIKNWFKKITLEAPHPAIWDPEINRLNFLFSFPKAQEFQGSPAWLSEFTSLPSKQGTVDFVCQQKHLCQASFVRLGSTGGSRSMSLGPKNMSATFAEDARGNKGGCKYMYPKSSKPSSNYLGFGYFVVFGAP